MNDISRRLYMVSAIHREGGYSNIKDTSFDGDTQPHHTDERIKLATPDRMDDKWGDYTW